jgi:hypothetical protein
MAHKRLAIPAGAPQKPADLRGRGLRRVFLDLQLGWMRRASKSYAS